MSSMFRRKEGVKVGRPRKDERERTVLAGGFTVLEGLAEEFKLMAEYLGVNQSEHFTRVAEEYLARKKEEHGVFSIRELMEKETQTRGEKREKNRADLADYLEEKEERKEEKEVKLRKKGA